MNTMSKIAIVVLAVVAVSSPALARHDGWHGWRYDRHHHSGWAHRGYPAVSDYYHHSRQLVGTR